MNLDKTLNNLRQTKNSYFNVKNDSPLNRDILKKGLCFKHLYRETIRKVVNIAISGYYELFYIHNKVVYTSMIPNDSTITYYLIMVKC